MKFKIFNLAAKTDGGYLLIEAIVAIFLLIVGFYAVFGLITNSIGLNKVAGDQFIANYLAMEGIEIVKNLIDANYLSGQPWNTGISGGNFEVDYKSVNLNPITPNNYILYNSVNGYNYQSGSPTAFIRTINIELLKGGEEIKINSVVRWKGRGGANFEANLEDHFFNWRPPMP